MLNVLTSEATFFLPEKGAGIYHLISQGHACRSRTEESCRGQPTGQAVQIGSQLSVKSSDGTGPNSIHTHGKAMTP